MATLIGVAVDRWSGHEHAGRSAELDQAEVDAGRKKVWRIAWPPRCAACSRVGSTSSARIDSETSIAIMTVARSRGRWTAAVGWAAPSARTASPAMRSANVRCRRHPGRFGATEASSETLLNRAAYLFLRNLEDETTDDG